ncbi:MAG TPA: type II/IV secretion system protein [Opitutaceae bacterium]|jgi:type II secretory ATPase GspE/PulE/Tfp pilus assembly ATPase PilB-like protein
MTAESLEPGREGESLDAFLLEKLAMAGVSDRQTGAAQAFHRQVEGRQPISRTLVELGLATDEAVARWIAEFFGWRYVPREELRVEGDAHQVLPESISRNRDALVIARSATGLVVAIADPTGPQFAQVRYALEGTPVEWVISPQADIAARVAAAYSPNIDVRDNELERFVEDMIREAAHTRGLSDIHCVPEDRSCEIRWRIDGDLVPWGTLPAGMRDAVCAQLKLSSTRGVDGRSRAGAASGGLDVANRLEAQDASAVREYGSKRISLRYSVVPAINGESIVIRILDQGAQVGSLEDLGMLGDTAVRFRTELKRPNGIILVSGPTGHGKSTTLAAAVPWLDSRNKRVLSVEDPVEYRLRTVTQVPVSPRLGFASALRAFLRHNPDIIIVGEIRDAETAALAMRLALTGHLILTTIHANSAVQAICRLLDLGVEAAMIATTTRFLLAQRLVRRLCPGCRKPHREAADLLKGYRYVIEAAQRSGTVRPASPGTPELFEAGGGCPACNRSGFAGRLGIFEFREIRRPLAERLIRQRNRFDPAGAELSYSAAARAGDLSARGLREDGLVKAAFGMTTPEEVFGATMDAEAM